MFEYQIPNIIIIHWFRSEPAPLATAGSSAASQFVCSDCSTDMMNTSALRWGTLLCLAPTGAQEVLLSVCLSVPFVKFILSSNFLKLF